MIDARNKTLLTQFEQYLAQIALSPKTITNYLADLRVFVRWAEATYPNEFTLVRVSPSQIRAYRNHLVQQNRASSTINRHLQALRKCCAYIAQTNLAPRNAAEEIPLVRAEKRTATKILTDAQLTALLNAAKKTRPSIAKRDSAILQLLINAGLRVAEVVDLQTEDVQFDYPGVHLAIRDSRGRGMREIPLPPDVCHELKEWLDIRPKTIPFPHVFLSQEGRPVSVRTVQRIVNRCAKQVGLNDITAQSLRRDYALKLLQESGSLELVRERLGHQNKQITLQYLNLSKADARLLGVDLSS